MALIFPFVCSRKVKVLLDSQAERPTLLWVRQLALAEGRLSHPQNQIPLAVELRSNDPLTIKDQGGEHQEAQHVASRADHCPLP